MPYAVTEVVVIKMARTESSPTDTGVLVNFPLFATSVDDTVVYLPESIVNS